MSGLEWGVVLGGLALGYWVVSFFTGARKPVATEVPPLATPGWPAVLGVPSDASVDDIRAAYRSLMSQYHPDKVATLGPELQALAERKSKEISSAYREALAAQGLDE